MRKIVTLCGSYKFKSSFKECKEILENDDCMILMPERIMDEINKIKPKFAHNYINNDSVFDPHMKEQ